MNRSTLLAALCASLLALPGRPAAAADAGPLTVEEITGVESLSGPTVAAAHVAPDGSRIAFLKGSTDNRFQLDIWLVDRDGGTPRRLTDSARLQPQEVLSDAEKARRERQRTAQFHGVLNYTWARDSKSILFDLGGDLYLQPVAAAQARPRLLLHAASAADAVLDPAVSSTGRYVSFIRRQNLWLLDLLTGRQRQLTHEGRGLVHAGEAEFVAQEEFGEVHGYWWAPDDSALVYKVVDESPVAKVQRLEVYAERAELIEQRYPAAGAANARVRLAVIGVGGGKPHPVPASQLADHYLTDLHWRPDSRGFAFERFNRAQNLQELVACDARGQGERVLVSESSATWIDAEHQFRWLKQGGFVWGSARSGFQHLYHYDAQGALVGALTSGPWSVDALLAIDEAADRVYFAGNRDGVATRQIYAVALGGGEAQRLSAERGTHHAEFAEHGAPYIDTWSDSDTPPRTAIFDAHGERLAWLEANPLDEHHPYWPHLARHARWEYGSLPGEGGVQLDYALLKPRDFQAGRRYPVVVLVYGGPTVQTIQDAWEGGLLEQFLVQQGYLVFRLDNRGSSRRGRAFQDPIFRRLGQVEVADQGAGLDWLRAQAFVDPARIGVFGWSYGGYMSLMMQARLADRLAAGVVVAPVTDWRMYDTAYTERYMGTPQDNPDGYRQGEVYPWLKGLRHPLLLIHGMADDNVLFTNSTRLMSELQAQDIPFDLMTYPGAKHGISTPSMRRHLYSTVRDFFARHLQPMN